MDKVGNVIVLSAGKGFQLDGVNKSLIKHPRTKKTILQHIVESFEGKKITVVAGYRAVDIMENYSDLNFIINHDWALTNNAMSLALALNGEPTYVVCGDLFIDKALVTELEYAPPDIAVVQNRENRTLTSIHCNLLPDAVIDETYQGPIKNIEHPESVGIFKISDSAVLKEWKNRCLLHANLFAGLLLPCEFKKIIAYELRNNNFFYEINTSNDYLKLLNREIKNV